MSQIPSTASSDTLQRVQLSVPDMHCAGCMGKVEKCLTALNDVTSARVNLSTRRVSIIWVDNGLSVDNLIDRLADKGYAAEAIDDMDDIDAKQHEIGREILRCLAVSGFAAANIMLLSVSVWSGAGDATRDLFHWISALVALPTILYAGQPFFRSTWIALSHRRMNMDVPISLSVVLAGGMSLYETMNSREHVYFDAAVTLLFFLLLGRYLDHLMRARVRNAAMQLVKLAPKTALMEDNQGLRSRVPVSALEIGMKVVVLPGAVVPVDGRIVAGSSELDNSIISGESLPELVSELDQVYSGSVNLTGSLLIEVTAVGKDSFLASVIHLMEVAEQHKSRYVRIADRLATIYAPFVHIVALMTFLGWLWVTQGDWHQALVVAISVLIITCPCALGLAVPVVQVVANGVLFDHGVLVKDGAALEKLAQIDAIVLDKTGTVTTGQLEAVNVDEIDKDALAIAAGLTCNSTHPLSRALTAAVTARNISPLPCAEFREHPGQGLEGICQGRTVRVGNFEWCGIGGLNTPVMPTPENVELWVRIENCAPVRLNFKDQLRVDAKSTIQNWTDEKLSVTLLSGDREAAVKAVAQASSIENFVAMASPAQKVDFVNELTLSGRRVLMVGDGINDAPALAAAHVSMAPAGASDISRSAADIIFLGDHLAPADYARRIARRASWLIQQNFALALLYNLVAIPIAIAGFASPLVAAIAMSTSSIIVTLNALRLRIGGSKGQQT